MKKMGGVKGLRQKSPLLIHERVPIQWDHRANFEHFGESNSVIREVKIIMGIDMTYLSEVLEGSAPIILHS